MDSVVKMETMSADTCATLATIFPIVLLAAVVEARSVNRRIKAKKVFGRIVTAGVSVTLVGLIWTVIGIQTRGLTDGWGYTAWVTFAVAVAVLFMVAVMIVASDEADTERQTLPTPEPTRAELLSDFIRGRRKT